MKKYAIIMVCLILSITSFGQNETTDNVTPPKFASIENAASMSTDNSLLIRNFIHENFCCPLNTVICNKEGTEVIQFTITPTGNVSNYKIVNSVCPDVDEELIRVLNLTDGMWAPGSKDGNPIAMEQEVSIMIGDYNTEKIADYFVEKAEKYFKNGTYNLLVKHKTKKALNFYNKGVLYLPYDKGQLMMRGICHYELGDIESAKQDWNRVEALGGINLNNYGEELTSLSSYSAMNKILANK